MRTNVAIQFRGVSRVMQAFEDYHCPRFAVFYGNQLLLKNNDGDFEQAKAMLSAYLQKLVEENQGETQGFATYTLAVYDKLDRGQRITNKTEYDGSFNFKLFTYEMDRKDGRVDQLQQEIALLREELAERETGPEPVGGINGFFDSILKMPQIQEAIGQRIAGLINSVMAPVVPIGKVAGPMSPVVVQPDNDLTRINTALQRIATIDPDIIEHLELIADLAEKSPEKYSGAITLLKTL